MRIRPLPVLLLSGLMLAGVAPAAHAATPDVDTVLDITFPVAGTDYRYQDDYESSRGGSRLHRSTDIMAPRGTPVHAAVGGKVSWITGLDGTPPSYGYMISIKGDDGLEHEYVHLGTQSGPPSDAYASGIGRGTRVERGQLIGFVGNSGCGCIDHLHYGIEDPRYPAQSSHYDNFRYNPYRSLRDAERRGDTPGSSGSDSGSGTKDGAGGGLPSREAVQPVVGDWDGNGTVTPGWYVDGTFHLSNRHDGGGKLISFRYGTAGDLPLVGDWDGNGTDTVGIVRDGEWHLINHLRGGVSQIKFIYGRVTRGDIPMAGDWDGNGTDTPAIVRDGEWHFVNTHRGGVSDFSFVYGRVLRGDIPLTGDWDGDGTDTAGIIRDGEWHFVNSHRGGVADHSFTYGRVSRGDVPIVGDWDGDGDTNVAIIRDTTWHYRHTNAGGAADATHTWGF